MAVKKVAFLTAGGLAPCLSSSIGFLIDEYTKKAPEVELIGYINGYMGLLKGESIKVTPAARKNALVLTKHGGSPIGNSRVKLTNVKDCVKRGLVKEAAFYGFRACAPWAVGVFWARFLLHLSGPCLACGGLPLRSTMTRRKDPLIRLFFANFFAKYCPNVDKAIG